MPAKLRDIPQPPVTRAKPNRIGWLIAAILGLAVIAGTSAWLLSRIPKHNAVNVPDKSIAVLPLENLTAEKENAYFADGIQDELLSDLAKIKDLKVISRTSVMQVLPTWKHLLNDTTIKLGCNNVFGHDPPDAAAIANYADFLYDSTGRFVYVSLTKEF